jgi:hypothetical protein
MRLEDSLEFWKTIRVEFYRIWYHNKSYRLRERRVPGSRHTIPVVEAWRQAEKDTLTLNPPVVNYSAIQPYPSTSSWGSNGGKS